MTEFWRARRVAVTGGAGFIGSHLVDALVALGARVLVLDNLYSGHLDNLVRAQGAISFQNIDVRQQEAVLKLLDGVEVVFHLAGNASVPASIENPCYDFESNVLGTYVMIQGLLQKRIARVIFSSSAAVYGVPRYVPTDEQHPLEPVSPYGASKLAAERLGVAYARSLGIDFLTVRIFNTFGPRQRKFVMYDLLNKLHADPNHLTVLGDGMQMRDYSYVDDTVRALLLIAERGGHGDVYNIAGNNPTSIRDLVTLLVEVLGISAQVKITYTGESWSGDVPAMVADISRLRALGFAPKKPFAEGIADLYHWMQADLDWAALENSRGALIAQRSH